MWISKLNVDGFGILANRKIEDISSNLVIIYGENEAGKSTLLSFVRAMLFGFGTKKEDPNKFAPTAGGAHQGTLYLNTSTDRYVITRKFAARANPALSITENDQVRSPEYLQSILGDATKELFKNIYAFSLQELRTLASLQSEEVKAALYGAAAGLSMMSLPAAQDSIEKKQSAIFLPQGQNPQLNIKIQQIVALQEKLAMIGDSVSRYGALNAEITDLNRTLELEKRKLVNAQAELGDVERLLKHSADWSTIQQKRNQIAALSAQVQVTSEQLEQYNTLKQKVSACRRQMADEQDAAVKAESAVREIVINEQILNADQAIADLSEILPEAKRCYGLVPTLKRSTDDALAAAQHQLTELGAGWDIARVQALQDRAVKENTVLGFQSKITIAETTFKQTEESKSALDKDLALKQQNSKKKLEELKSCTPEAFQVTAATIGHVRTGIAKYVSDFKQQSARNSERDAASAGVSRILMDVETKLGRIPSNLKPLENLQKCSQIADFEQPDLHHFDTKHFAPLKTNLLKSIEVEDAAKRQLDKAIEDLSKLTVEEAPLVAEIEGLGTDGVALEKIEAAKQDHIRLTEGIAQQVRLRDAVNDRLEELKALQLDSRMQATFEQLTEINFPESKKFIDSAQSSRRSLEHQRQVCEGSEERCLKENARQGDRLARAQGEFNDLLNSIGIQDCSEADVRLDRLIQYRTILSDVNRSRTNLAHAEERLRDATNTRKTIENSAQSKSAKQLNLTAVFLLVTGIILTGILALKVNVESAVGCAVVVIAALVFVLRRNRTTGDAADFVQAQAAFEKNIANLEGEISALKNSFEALSLRASEFEIELGLKSSRTESELTALIDELTQHKFKLTMLLNEIETTKLDRDKSAIDLENAASQRTDLERQFAQLSQEWAQWCEPQGFDLQLEPLALLENLRLITDKISIINQQKMDLVSFESGIEKYADNLRNICSITTESAPNLQMVLAISQDWIQAAAQRQADEQRREICLAKLEQIKISKQGLEASSVAAEKAHSTALAKKLEFQASWANWLAEADLPSDLAAEAAEQIVVLVEELVALIKTFCTALAEVDRLSPSIRAFQESLLSIPELNLADVSDSDEVQRCVDNLIKRFDAALGLHQQKELVQKELDAAKTAEEDAAQGQRDAGTALTNAIDELANIKNEWKTWLVGIGLESLLEPGKVLQVVKLASAILRQHAEHTKLKLQVEQTEGIVSAFKNSLNSLLAKVALPQDIGPDWAAQADWLIEEREGTKRKALIKEEKRLFSLNVADKLKALGLQDQEGQDALKVLLQLCACANELEFLDRAAQSKALSDLRKEVDVRIQNLCTSLTVGAIEELEELYRLFNDIEYLKLKTTLGSRIADLTETIEGVGGEDTDQVSGLRHQLTNLIAKRDDLANSDDLQKLKTDEQRLLKEAENLASLWSKLTIAQHLFERAKKRFEREGQPHVVELASGYFNDITSGAYKRIIAVSDDGGKMRVVQKNDHELDVDLLSTGTQEQLYLSLRFAFIHHRASATEPLPVAMDDILVNFDPARATRAAYAISELSKTHQVLFFTCHPATIGYFRQINRDVQVINLSNDDAPDTIIKKLIDTLAIARGPAIPEEAIED